MDGSGKTTQTRRLLTHLGELGLKAVSVKHGSERDVAIAASRILAMNMHAPVPFLTIILDTKYAIARVRLSKRSAKAELFDTSDAMLAADRRYQAMESYCRDTGERFVYVDGDDAEDDVAERVRDAVTPWVT